ncbi:MULTISPECIES: PGPGW domain-containing protein [unclassified Arthrobacter]|uniref:PGPGW domain-containing protein n=1 Tax=unclassified Arthrobacter TaxID=235627 RepID=UPI001E593E80|nr:MULTISPECIES: PGPGW domain-containing protein [unclassified Arthrobacter]MCC9145126.1 PGPGW domain-containing protein [Arthrobacter sp. zg-Y919]MDK1276354.1 PGPGW domain-containing protein [Arthrobacter sp. zg.Y919]WIB02043.1 PGPGW domain-containing protein [Arthrobacter sp. zg-Y919]
MMTTEQIPPWLRRTGIEVAGWSLVVLGLAALVLPGPGLLMVVAGLAVLSLRYHWAHRWLHPVKERAFRAAAQQVQTVPRIIATVCGGLLVIAAGVIWGLWRQVPNWWPLQDSWWLPGGWVTGGTLIGSGCIGLALIVYSYIRFRGPGSSPHS